MADLVNAFGKVTLESTQQQILEMQTIIKAQGEMIQAYLAHIAENMPRTDANNRAIVNTSDQGNVTVGIAATQTLATVTTVGTLNSLGSLGGYPVNALAFQFSNAGAMHLYDHITVS